MGPSGWPSPGEELGLCFTLFACSWALPARAFWPPGQDRPQQVDLVRGCAGATWTMGGGPTGRETGGVTGARGLSSREFSTRQQLKACREQLLTREAEIAQLKAERSNTRVSRRSLTC
ncbi:hypothetical protein KIN20_027397 [Parelaphostrongylus tenuis]|uniref:Uncharacterized protein n=1 Tax=Parelaphostrongylus tenuis TaxID=148309 RepID=A0AAD5WDU5_PARTN|nr:hypothetical protein KIN20_027397 [Parelaphostrongylus tenuis]